MSLVTAAILEEKMERMSCFTSHRCSTSHWHSASHWCRRSRSLGHQDRYLQVTSHCGECKTKPEDTQTDSHQEGRLEVDFHQWLPQVTPCQRGTIWGWTQSPSPTRQKHWVTFTKGRALMLTEEPGMWCWSGWHLPVAPINVADWGGATGRSWLVQVKGRGWDHPSQGRGRSGEFSATGTSPQTTPGWGGVIPSWHWGGRWPAAPTNINAWRSRALSSVSVGRDRVACQTCPDVTLVEGTCEDPWPWWPPGVCQGCMPPSRCLRHGTGWRGGQWSHPTSAPIYWKVLFYATLRCKVQLSGLPTHPITPYPHLCEGNSVLGWEGPTTDSWLTLLSGRKCDGTLVGNGATGLIYRSRGFHGHCAIQLDGGDLAQVDGSHPTRPPFKSQLQPQLKLLGPPRGSLSVVHGEGWPTTTQKTDALTAPSPEVMPLQFDHKPHGLCLGLWRMHEPCRGKNQWTAVQHWSSASCLKKSWTHMK